MELFFLCVALAAAMTHKYTSETAKAAYKAGKEPPGLAKARLRHESGGGSRKPSGKPTGKGGFRRLMAEQWHAGCDNAIQRAQRHHQRHQAWIAENAPEKDAEWLRRQRTKLAHRRERADAFAAKRGMLTHPLRNRQEKAAQAENARRDAATEQHLADAAAEANQLRENEEKQNTAADDTEGQQPTAGESAAGDIAGEPSTPEESRTTTSGASPEPASTTYTKGGSVYERGAAELQDSADEIEGYRDALTQLGQDLEAIGWGAEVHGPLSEMHTQLAEAASIYRDLADQIKNQGDTVNDAMDTAPWAPDHEALMA